MNGDPIAGTAGPSLGFWSHIWGTDRDPVLSSRVPLPDFLACIEDAQRLRLPSAPPPAGAYRFAPDPVSEKRKWNAGYFQVTARSKLLRGFDAKLL